MFKKEISVKWLFLEIVEYDLSCECGSVGLSEGLLIHRLSVRFNLKPENSNSHGFELRRALIKGTKLLKAIISIKVKTKTL